MRFNLNPLSTTVRATQNRISSVRATVKGAPGFRLASSDKARTASELAALKGFVVTSRAAGGTRFKIASCSAPSTRDASTKTRPNRPNIRRLYGVGEAPRESLAL